MSEPSNLLFEHSNADVTKGGGDTAGSEKKGKEKRKKLDYDDLDDFLPEIDPDQAEYFSRLKYSDHYAWSREESYM